MCRIVYSPNSRVSYNKGNLNKFFTRLENKAGGDGNGIYLLKKHELYKTMEKVEKAEFFNDKTIDYKNGFIFHTRMRTHGEKKKFNCQPLEGSRYIIAHNGVFSQHSTVCAYLGLMDRHSDSHSILRLIEERGLLNFYMGFNDRYYGVVLVYDKKTDIIYLLKTSGSFEMGVFDNDGVIYASSNVDFWDVDSKVDIGKGMYILNSDGFIKIHTPKSAYVRTQTATGGTTTGYGSNFYTNYYDRDDKDFDDFPCGINERCFYQCGGADVYCWIYTQYEAQQRAKKKKKTITATTSTTSTDGKDSEEDWDGTIRYYPSEDLNPSIHSYELESQCDVCEHKIHCVDCLAYIDYMNEYWCNVAVKAYPCGNDKRCDCQCYKQERDCELLTIYDNDEIKKEAIKKESKRLVHNKGCSLCPETTDCRYCNIYHTYLTETENLIVGLPCRNHPECNGEDCMDCKIYDDWIENQEQIKEAMYN